MADLAGRHRQAACPYFVLTKDLKVDKLSFQDVGQMDMYLRLYDQYKRCDGDNPTIGIVLCSETDGDVARFSSLADNDKMYIKPTHTADLTSRHRHGHIPLLCPCQRPTNSHHGGIWLGVRRDENNF